MGSALFRWRLVVIVGFFAVAIGTALALARLPAPPTPLLSWSALVGVPAAFALSGAVCFAAGVLRVLGEARVGSAVYGQHASARLVTGGPFSFTRHPLYVGTWLFFVSATAPYLPPVVTLVLAVVFAATLATIAGHEERELAARHGDDWARYAQAVPRLPGLPRKVEPDGIVVTGRARVAATLGNLGILSIGAYRMLVALGAPARLLGLLNVLCLVVWLVVVLVRRVRT